MWCFWREDAVRGKLEATFKGSWSQWSWECQQFRDRGWAEADIYPP